MITSTTYLFEELNRLIENKCEELAENLARGCASSYDQYRHLTGVVAGLQMAMEIASEAKNKADRVTSGK